MSMTGESDSGLPPGLAAPALRALAQAGYTRVEQFAALTEGELLKLHGMGPNAIEKTRRALAAKGLAFSK
jgi:hypothetical protein